VKSPHYKSVSQQIKVRVAFAIRVIELVLVFRTYFPAKSSVVTPSFCLTVNEWSTPPEKPRPAYGEFTVVGQDPMGFSKGTAGGVGTDAASGARSRVSESRKSSFHSFLSSRSQSTIQPLSSRPPRSFTISVTCEMACPAESNEDRC